MKIVICVNHYAPLLGGCEIVTQHISEYLSQYHEVFVITRRVPGISRNNSGPVKVLEYIPNNSVGFEKQIKSINPNVVLVYSDVFDFFRYFIYNQNPTWKLILAPCGANFLYNNRTMVNRVCSGPVIQRIICHSKSDRDYKIFNSNITPEKMIIIPNGIDIDEFDENKLSREEIVHSANIDERFINLRWVLNVSNFFPGKGHNHMPHILSMIPDPHKFVYIQVCSQMSFPIGEQIENDWYKKMKLTTVNTVLLKNISRQITVGLFKNSNVFVFPSEKEVAPLVLLECMAACLPWVSMDVGNAIELSGGKCIPSAKNSNYQSIFSERVCGAFSNFIQNIWESPSIANDGRMQVEKDLNWKNILPRYKDVVESCCA